jgi:hypothetical protein
VSTSWGFNVDDEQVDLQRIHDELNGHTAAQVFAYLGELKKRAPRVYQRLGQWARERGVMNYVKWGDEVSPTRAMAALKELVRLNGIHDRLESNEAMTKQEWQSLQNDYRDNNPKAWAAARAIVEEAEK